MRAQCGERPVSRVDAVNKHAAFGRVVETGDEVDEGGFACAGFAENAEFGTCQNMEVDVFEHGGVRFVGEGEADMLEVDAACDAGCVGCCSGCSRCAGVIRVGAVSRFFRIFRLFRDVRLRGEQFADFDAGCVETLPVVDQPSGLAYRPVDHPQVGVERHKIAERHAPGDHQESAEAERDQLQ